MIYLDTSVALAQMLGEDRTPDEALWGETLVSSRLLEYEIWTRLHGDGLGASHAAEARAMVGRVALVKLEPLVLSRACEPFPRPVGTLDALHLATFGYLLENGHRVALATYDDRMTASARDLGWPLAECG